MYNELPDHPPEGAEGVELGRAVGHLDVEPGQPGQVRQGGELEVGVAEAQLRELAELEAAGPEAAEVVPGAEAGEGGHAAQQLREAARGHARPVHVQALAEAVTACYGEIPLNYCSQSSIFTGFPNHEVTHPFSFRRSHKEKRLLSVTQTEPWTSSFPENVSMKRNLIRYQNGWIQTKVETLSSDFLNERIVRKVQKCQRVQVLDGGDESRGLRGTEVG